MIFFPLLKYFLPSREYFNYWDCCPTLKQMHTSLEKRLYCKGEWKAKFLTEDYDATWILKNALINHL